MIEHYFLSVNLVSALSSSQIPEAITYVVKIVGKQVLGDLYPFS